MSKVIEDLREKPQSNQRGIETRPFMGGRPGARGLNRTSVGLKQEIFSLERHRQIRLNRTSVGLKPEVLVATQGSLRLPQSNQRGIETSRDRSVGAMRSGASIEPAWD